MDWDIRTNLLAT